MAAHHEAWKDGKVWCRVSFSGGKGTPLLGPMSIKASGPKDPDTAFLMYMLFCGHSVKSAQAELKKAKAAEKAFYGKRRKR